VNIYVQEAFDEYSSNRFSACVASLLVTPAMAADTKALTGDSVTLTNSMVTPLSVEVGGGTWDYGTKIIFKSWSFKKKVWSNYWHPTAIHRSSCKIGTNYSDSGWVAQNTTSFSSAIGDRDDTAYAYWDKL
jgi:hypothetical protein